MGDNLEFLVKTIALALVDQPDEVEVSSVQGQRSTVIELKVAQDDIGKVIGRKGTTANAFRVLLHNAAGKLKTNVILQIIEPEKASKVSKQ